MTHTNVFSARIGALGDALRTAAIDLYLQPMGDEFQGEYVPAHAARLPYLTGFTGSAGLGAFWAQPEGRRQHTLFVDGRYTIQAAQELAGSGVQPVNSGEMTLAQWLEIHASAGLRIGFDPWLVTQAQLQHWKKATISLGVEWVAIANPVDGIWQERPAAPAGEVVLHAHALAGKTYAEKRAPLVELLAVHKADALVLALPDGINWLLNIRGSDIPFNPLLLSYFVLQKNGQGTLYSYGQAFSQEVADYFSENNILTESIQSVFFGNDGIVAAPARVLIDPTTAAFGWWQKGDAAGWEIIAADDATLLPKACKNAVELDGIRAAHRRDGAALSRFLHWFDTRASVGQLPDELTVVRVLDDFRARDNRYRGPSFATIAGSGAHGAIVHYRADQDSNRQARKGELFLLDSGGQYDDGTTDVTRTIAVGEPSNAMREHFTRVLKGHIALARAKFPEGTSGGQLDVLARQFLWEAGLDYDHGTGHGVGAYLCVHEGPQRISKKGSAVALQAGMVLSNEPGYYAANAYGIRIENLVAVVEVARSAEGKAWLGFETLTLAPIDVRLIQVELLTSDERNWLNAYHRTVYKTHVDALDAQAGAWLANATRAV